MAGPTTTAATSADWPMIGLLLFPGAAFRRAARPRLARLLQRSQAEQVWAKIRARHRQLSATQPRHRWGLMRILAFMQWHCALYSTLTAEGLSRQQAGEIVEAINRDIFGPVMQLSFALSRLRSGQRLLRVRWIIDLLFTLIFTAPFRRQILGHGLRFDVHACPLADYFRERGLPELTHHAACQLDYHMAQIWGVELVRHGGAAAKRQRRNAAESP